MILGMLQLIGQVGSGCSIKSSVFGLLGILGQFSNFNSMDFHFPTTTLHAAINAATSSIKYSSQL